MTKHITYSLLISLSYLLILPYGQAELPCGTEVRVNDSSAKVFVDGVPTKNPPVRISCKSKPQLITVSTADGQTLMRKMPSMTQFANEDREWNVFFLPQNSKNSHAQTMATHLQTQTAYDNRILNELSEIKKLVEKLALANPEIKRGLEKAMRAVDRNVASVASANLSGDHISGPYVQLHSLARTNFRTTSVKSELSQQVAGISGQVLKFCNWKKDDSSPNWTRVMIGPFENDTQARKFAGLFGRQAFAVKSLLCKEPAAAEVKL